MAAADGHRQAKSTETYRVELANEELIADLRHLSFTCGVRTGSVLRRNRTAKPPHSPKPIEAISWSVSLNFATVSRTEYDPHGWVAAPTLVGARRAARLLGDDSRVVSVEPAGQEHVWDLMVEGTHAFLAEGLAVHNTRKHFDDLYARLIADTSYHVLAAAKSVFFPDGSPIWPEMWSVEALLERKKQLDAQDLLAWPQEYLNEPRPSETQMFYPEKWPTYANTPYSLTILQFWDLAISEKTNADYTCGWTIGVDEWLHRHRPSRRGHVAAGLIPTDIQSNYDNEPIVAHRKTTASSRRRRSSRRSGDYRPASHTDHADVGKAGKATPPDTR